MFKSIRMKVLLIVSISIFLLLAGSTFFAYNQTSKIMNKTLFNSAAENVNQNARLLSHYLNGIIDQVEKLSENNAIKSMSWLQQQPFLKIVTDNQENIKAFYVADTYGDYNTTMGNSGKIVDKDYFQRVLNTNNMVISRPFK